MDTEIIDAGVKKLFIKYLHITPAQYRLEAHIVDDLGADSLDAVELVMAREEEFDIEITDEEARAALTVNDVLELVRSRTRPNRAMGT